jgi:hypothetical protein
MGRWHLLTVATATKPAYQQPKVATDAVMYSAHCYWEFKSSRQNRDARRYLIWPACQSPNVTTGMKSTTPCYYEFEAPCPMTEASLQICHRRWLYKLEWPIALCCPTDHSLPL